MGLAETPVKYLTKVVLFNGMKMTLFSLDGNTWSTRKVELSEIKARQELQRAELAGKKEDGEDDAIASGGSKLAEEEHDGPPVHDEDDAPVRKSKLDDEDQDEDDDAEASSALSDSDDDDSVDEATLERARQTLRAKGRGTGNLPTKPAAAQFAKAKPSGKVAPKKVAVAKPKPKAKKIAIAAKKKVKPAGKKKKAA